jgi:hypothetical protein
MKPTLTILFVAIIGIFSATLLQAQDASIWDESQKLRSQLTETQDHQAEIKMRLQELEFDLKPENIERYFAGYGSTRPEELREARRKQLESEKDRLTTQYGQLEDNRIRLESAIVTADARAYQHSSMGSISVRFAQNRRAGLFTATRLLIGGSAVILVGGVFAFLIIRRRRQSVA